MLQSGLIQTQETELIQSNVQVFPSSILVLNTTMVPDQDAACNTLSTEFLSLINQSYYRCSLSQSRTPFISDCDLGPNVGVPDKKFYSLKATSETSIAWLGYEFQTSGLKINKVVLFYYCTVIIPTGETLPLNLFWAVISRFDITTIDQIDDCGSSPNIRRNVTLPFTISFFNNTLINDDMYFLGVYSDATGSSTTFMIYLSEVQFFSNQTTGELIPLRSIYMQPYA